MTVTKDVLYNTCIVSVYIEIDAVRLCYLDRQTDNIWKLSKHAP